MQSIPSLSDAEVVSRDVLPTKGKSEEEGDQSEGDSDDDDAEESAFVIGGR